MSHLIDRVASPRRPRIVVAAALLVAGLTAGGVTGTSPASAVPAVPPITDQAACLVELTANDTGNSLTKTIDDVTDNGNGTYTVAFSYESTRPDGTYSMRDCAFVDANGNGEYDLLEPITATPATQVALVGGAGSSQITVTAEPGDSICDRFVISGTGPPNFTHRSAIVCADTAETQIPVGAVGGLGAAALLALVLGVVLVARRRSVGRSI